MAEYLIAFDDNWVPDHTVEELGKKAKAVRALVTEMKATGVLVFTGGLDDAAPVFTVDASSGAPLFTDGPYIESKEHLGGFAVVDVPDEAAARLWAGKIALACGWPQEVRRFRVPEQTRRHRRGARDGVRSRRPTLIFHRNPSLTGSVGAAYRSQPMTVSRREVTGTRWYVEAASRISSANKTLVVAGS